MVRVVGIVGTGSSVSVHSYSLTAEEWYGEPDSLPSEPVKRVDPKPVELSAVEVGKPLSLKPLKIA